MKRAFGLRTRAAMVVALVAGCYPGGGAETGGQTNWLRACRADAECGSELSCVCGACTRACKTGDSSCSDLPDASCVSADEAGSIALCGGRTPPVTGICMARCGTASCERGTTCTAGVCVPLRQPTVRVTVDASTRYQTLVGIGAGTGYVEDELVQHPAKAALYDAMFLQSGFDVLRIGNRNDGASVTTASAAEIVGAAGQRLGHTPTLFMTSASPPAALKANGATSCGGNPDTCTLHTLANGSFDYPGFADYWRTSLDAYAAAGVAPDFIGIQNDPDWVPPSTAAMDACSFLPRQGTATVSVNGANVQVPYPGFVEALTAVKSALAGLASVPKIAAPESTGVQSTVTYASQLDLTAIDAIAHHMYGSDTAAPDQSALLALNNLGQQSRLPIFQTEMQSNGLDTAILMNEALGTIGASVYLQNDFLGSANLDPNPTALIALSQTGFTIQDPYTAMRHYALDTDPGWVRVATASDQAGVLATAWLSPPGDALTVVLVNPDTTDAVVELALGTPTARSTVVTRTVFPGVERFADLGALSADGTVALPGQSIVTVSVRR